MKRYRSLAVFSVFILSSLACSFSDRLRNVRVIDRLIGDNSADVETAPKDVVQEFTDDPVRFSCQAESLESYMGENWQFAPTDLTDLILDVFTKGDTLEYNISFSSASDLIIDRDPDYRPPPGATQVPEGVYDFEEKYWGSGAAELDRTNFSGKIRVDYEHITHFPDPISTSGSLEFPVLATANMGDLEICFNIVPGLEDATASNPGKLLRPNCLWPGYVFVCTAVE